MSELRLPMAICRAALSAVAVVWLALRPFGGWGVASQKRIDMYAIDAVFIQVIGELTRVAIVCAAVFFLSKIVLAKLLLRRTRHTENEAQQCNGDCQLLFPLQSISSRCSQKRASFDVNSAATGSLQRELTLWSAS